MSGGIVVCVAVVCVTECITQELTRLGLIIDQSVSQMQPPSSVLSGMICDIEKVESMFELGFPEPLR
jgi:hypothetical protein